MPLLPFFGIVFAVVLLVLAERAELEPESLRLVLISLAATRLFVG